MEELFKPYVGCFEYYIIFQYAIFKTYLFLSICSLKANVHTCSQTQVLDIMFSGVCMEYCSVNSTHRTWRE